jgi:hypothetical protein
LPKAHDTGLIDYDDSAETNPTFFVPQTVGLRYLAFGMPIGKFRVGEPAHRRGPCPMRRNMITTDAQNLGLPLLQPAMITPEGDGLLRSTTGEVKDVKG